VRSVDRADQRPVAQHELAHDGIRLDPGFTAFARYSRRNEDAVSRYVRQHLPPRPLLSAFERPER
jgi:hypothetical protein